MAYINGNEILFSASVTMTEGGNLTGEIANQVHENTANIASLESKVSQNTTDIAELRELVENGGTGSGGESGGSHECEVSSEEFNALVERVTDLEENGTGSGTHECEVSAVEFEALKERVDNLEDTDTSVDPEAITEAVETWLDEHPEATTTIPDSFITVEKMSAYKGKVVRNMFGNMGIKFGTYDESTHIFTEDETSMHFAAFTKLEPSKKYYMQVQRLGVLANLAPLTMYFYDAEGTFLKNSYSWDSTFTTPENTAYGIYYVKSSSGSQKKYDGQPYQLLDEPITGIYPYAYEETLYAEDLTKEQALIEHIAGEQQEIITEKITNYNSKTQDTIVEVKGGEVFTTNLFALCGSYYCDEKCEIKACYGGTNGAGDFRVNNEVTGELPATTQFTIPDGVTFVKFTSNGGDYPNTTQSEWYEVENPQIVRGTELIENIKEGENFGFVGEAKTAIEDIAKEQANEAMKAGGVISPLNGKNWMIWGDSTSCYSGKNYPDWIAERTGCITHNKAKAGWRVTTVGEDSSIAKLVVADITADMEVLTLIGGYNDRRSYDSTNPDWTWLGSMLGTDGTPNLDDTTFYGALNTIASKWYEVCPEATKAFFTIFPCGTNPNGEYETKINDIIKEVANYWCIPCFDLWNEVGLPVRLDYINETYYMGDRIHPNPEGNRVASVYIQKKLESIMI